MLKLVSKGIILPLYVLSQVLMTFPCLDHRYLEFGASTKYYRSRLLFSGHHTSHLHTHHIDHCKLAVRKPGSTVHTNEEHYS